MDKSLLFLSTSLICLASLGNLATAQIKDNNPSSGSEEHHHEMLAIPDGNPIPTVDLIVHQDTMKGWNLELKTTNFEFAPKKVNRDDNLSEGHAHLYVNGKKITRLYGNWYYLSQLEPGTNQITVRLNTNGHKALMYQGKAIEDTEIVEVKEE